MLHIISNIWTINCTEWPYLCWSAVKKLLSHVSCLSSLLLYSRFLTSSLCLHTSLSSAAHLSATKPPSFAKSCSIWILLLPLGLLLILPSVISCKSPSCLKTWAIHRCFLCQTEFSICLFLFTLLRTSSLVTLSSQLIFSILLHIHISKASNLLLFVCVNVHVSAAYINLEYNLMFLVQ